MRLLDLKTRFRDRPSFTLADLHSTKPHQKHELVQLNRWVKDGHVIRLRRGMYTLSKNDRAAVLHPCWLANHLYEPSYISLQYALSFYGLIPEAVGVVTSVSERKTATFNTPVGRFTYQSIKAADFYGFQSAKVENTAYTYWIASPEKAVLDFLHLCLPAGKTLTPELLLEGYRFQNMDALNKEQFLSMMQRFSVFKTRDRAALFAKLIPKRRTYG